MDSTLKGLIEVLEDELELHKDLYEKAVSKREAIVSVNMDRLGSILGEEMEIIARVAEAEARRLELVEDLKAKLGIEKPKVRLSDIIERIDGPFRGRLAYLKEELTAIVKEVKKMCAHNAELLRYSTEHIDGFIRLIARSAQKNFGYSESGAERRTDGAVLVDRTA